jgi:crotonobetainyl-CoA:carnitine CoA-transferase CaiB-like acyl-CoA transferase
LASGGEALHLPQLEGRELFLDLTRRETVLDAGFRYSRDGPQVCARAPGLGEHSEEVLAELGPSTVGSEN